MIRIRKHGRKPSRKRVIWLGTVQMRPAMYLNPNADGRGLSGKLREIFGEGAPGLALEQLRHRGDGAGRLVEGDALDAVHGEKEGGQAGALAVGHVDLPDEMVKRIQVNPADGDARRRDRQQLAPELFLGAVQTDDDDGVNLHGPRWKPLNRQNSAFGRRGPAR